MLPEVISGSIGLLDTVSPIRRLLPRTNLHVREVESIDVTNKTITTSPGFRPHAHTIEYDYFAQNILMKRGIEIRLNTRLEAATGEEAILELKQTTRGATVRCTAPIDTLSLPKREFSILAAYLPQMRETLEGVMEQRARSNAQKSMGR